MRRIYIYIYIYIYNSERSIFLSRSPVSKNIMAYSTFRQFSTFAVKHLTTKEELLLLHQTPNKA